MDRVYGKYEYGCETDIPCAVLKAGEEGIIRRVEFFPKYDHIIGVDLDLNLETAVRHFHAHGMSRESRAIRETTLEICGDFELEMLSEEEIGSNASPPLEELKQVRELERLVRKAMGDYRHHTIEH